MAIIEFNDTPITIVDRDGQPWFLGRDLGFEDVEKFNQIYRRNSEEFQGIDTCTLKLSVDGDDRPRIHRIYSKTGAYLAAMMAKTEKAAKFRRWLVEVLNGDVALPGYEDTARTKAILDGLRNDLLNDFPELIEHMRLARSGHTMTEIAKAREMDVMDVGVHERRLQEYGFDTPNLIQYDQLIHSNRKSIVEARNTRARGLLSKQIGGRKTHLIDDTQKKKKTDGEGDK